MILSLAPLVLSLIAPAASDFDDGYEKGFRESFRASSIEACVAAVKHPAPAGIDIRRICTCATDRGMRSKSPAEMSAISQAEIDATLEACVEAEVGEVRRR